MELHKQFEREFAKLYVKFKRNKDFSEDIAIDVCQKVIYEN